MPEPVVTKHQWRIAKLIAEGRSDKEIAFIVGVTYATVKAHTGNLRTSLGLKGACRVRLAYWYLSQCTPQERNKLIAGWRD